MISPTPWRLVRSKKPKFRDNAVFIMAAGGAFVGKVYGHDGEPMEENAKAIVEAINSRGITQDDLDSIIEGVHRGYQESIDEKKRASRALLALLQDGVTDPNRLDAAATKLRRVMGLAKEPPCTCPKTDCERHPCRS